MVAEFGVERLGEGEIRGVIRGQREAFCPIERQ